MKIIKSLEKSGLLIKGFNKKDMKVLGDSLLENPLKRTGVMRAGEGRIRADQDF